MRPIRVLIVDDNPANLKLLRVTLETEGFDVRSAAAAAGLWRELAQQLPDIILMDIQLPGTDGLTLTRRLKSGRETSGVVCIAVTAYAMCGDRERALAAGADGYLSKPIDPIELPAMLRRVIAGGVAPGGLPRVP